MLSWLQCTSHREWLEEFIEIYHSEPWIWKVKSVRLVIKFKEIWPQANKESVVNIINTIFFFIRPSHSIN